MANESINDFAIKLSADITGVATGMRAATALILQSQREQAKAEQIEREINLQQKIESEEKFDKWYASELEREFQSWYKVEQQKETILAESRARAQAEHNAGEVGRAVQIAEARVAQERLEQRQTSWSAYLAQLSREERDGQNHAHNVGQIYRLLVNRENQASNERLAQRQQEADKLRAWYADMERYSEQNLHNTAEISRIKLANDERAIEKSFLQRQEDYNNLKSYYAREEAAGELRAEVAARQARARQLDEKRAADDLRRQQLNNMGAANNQRLRSTDDRARTQAQDAATQRNNADIAAATQVIQRHLTVQERHGQELYKLTKLYNTYNIQTGKALLTEQQFVRAKTALTIQTIRAQQAMTAAGRTAVMAANGYGGMAMAIGQTSYAAEDFIQVLSMGGGLNMALMSASNNLSMVVRSLAGTSGALAAIAGFAVPVVLIGIGSLIKYMMSEEKQVDNVRHAYERLREELERVHSSRSKMLELKFALEDIALVTDLQTALRDINELQRERLRIEEDILKNQEELKAAQKDADKMLTGQAGVGEYIAELEAMRNKLQNTPKFAGMNAEAIFKLLEQIDNAIDNTTKSYSRLQEALATGTGEDVIAAAMSLQQALDSMPLQSGPAGDAMSERLDEILNSGENIATIVKRINEEIAQGAAFTEDLEIKMKKLESLEQRRKELLEEQNNALRVAQQEYLLKLKMTDAERELYDLRKAQQEFMGPAAGGMTGMGGPGAAMQAMLDQAAAVSFLEAQRDMLRKDLDALVPEIIAKAGLEQSALDAQAKAFDQMMQTSAKKPNPQIERTNKLLESIDTAIKNGGRIEIIQ